MFAVISYHFYKLEVDSLSKLYLNKSKTYNMKKERVEKFTRKFEMNEL